MTEMPTYSMLIPKKQRSLVAPALCAILGVALVGTGFYAAQLRIQLVAARQETVAAREQASGQRESRDAVADELNHLRASLKTAAAVEAKAAARARDMSAESAALKSMLDVRLEMYSAKSSIEVLTIKNVGDHEVRIDEVGGEGQILHRAVQSGSRIVESNDVGFVTLSPGESERYFVRSLKSADYGIARKLHEASVRVGDVVARFRPAPAALPMPSANGE